MIMGYHPQALPEYIKPTNVPLIEQRLEHIVKLRMEAGVLHELARQRMAKRSKQGSPTFKLGQKVWLKARNLNLGFQSKKMAPKQEGLFEITQVMDLVTYKLKLPKQWQIHPVFHAALLLQRLS